MTLSPALRAWRERGQRWTFRGQSIFYLDEGQGPAVLLVHGYPTASWDWHLLWPHLIEDYRLVACDMVGFGFSSKPTAWEYSIHGQTDLQEALLEHLDLDQVHLLAHDYGVSVAQELVARQAERESREEHGMRLLSVCLLNGGLFPETHRARPIQKLLLSPLGGLVGRLIDQGRFERSFSAVFGPDTQPTERELESFWQLIEHGGGRRLVHRLVHYVGDRRRHRERWVEALRHPGLPIRLINGLEDPVSGAHLVERYRELVPQPDVVPLPGIGHYPQVEAPERVAKAVREHLATAGDPREPGRAD